MKIVVFVFVVFLSLQIKAQSSANSQIIQNSLQEFSSASSSSGYNFGTGIVAFSTVEDTKGSRYLFPVSKWVRGSVEDKQGVIIDNKNYWYNFDKITSNLYVTQDKKQVVLLDKANLKSFKLFTEDELSFVRIPFISENNFLQELCINKTKFSLYKLYKTKYEKANYVSDGLVERGHNYDEYIDEPIYFVVFPTANQFRTIELRKKSIKEVFYTEQEKVKKYLSNNYDQIINETFLIDLVQYLNN